jgi:hypothetical protein
MYLPVLVFEIIVPILQPPPVALQPSLGPGRIPSCPKPFVSFLALGRRPVRRSAIFLFTFSTLEMLTGWGCQPQAQPADFLAGLHP